MRNKLGRKSTFVSKIKNKPLPAQGAFVRLNALSPFPKSRMFSDDCDKITPVFHQDTSRRKAVCSLGFVSFLRQKEDFLSQYFHENCLLQKIVCKVEYQCFLSLAPVCQFWSWVVLSYSPWKCYCNSLFTPLHSGGEELTIRFKGEFAKTGRILDRCNLSIIINSQEEISLSPVARVWTPSLSIVNRWVIDSFVDALRGDTVGSIQGHIGHWVLEF